LKPSLAWIGKEIWVQADTREPFLATLAGIAPDGGLKILRNGKQRGDIYRHDQAGIEKSQSFPTAEDPPGNQPLQDGTGQLARS
jgi:hypothetical protein